MSSLLVAAVVAVLASTPGGADAGAQSGIAPPSTAVPKTAAPEAAPAEAAAPSVLRAADGTPMVLEDGSPNLAFFQPPKSYRSPEGLPGGTLGHERDTGA